jgi:hypothetical protein
MGPPFPGIDIIHKGKHDLVIPVVILDGALHFHPVPAAFDKNLLLIEDSLIFVKVLHKALNPTVKLKVVDFGGGESFVPDGYLEALVKKGQFPQPVRKGIEIIGSSLKN